MAKIPEILSEAEGALKVLIEQALADKRYRDASFIAATADQLATLVDRAKRGLWKEPVSSEGTTTVTPWNVIPAVTHPMTKDKTGDSRGPSLSHRRQKYPYFERDGETLVKIGWSTRDRRTYEHRAPREVVMTFTNAVNELAGDGRLFRMVEVFPVMGRSGTEVPTYQAYLAMAWLRSIGAVERRGRDGYSVQNGGCQPSQITTSWANLQERN